MSAVLASRVNYFDRQFIRLAEMRDEQSYHRQLHRRHNLSHHSWGIVSGLDVVLEDDRPVVRPGFAVDGYGRDLLLLERAVYGRDQFDRLATSRLDLWLEYRLDLSDDKLAPMECGETDADRRYRATERAQVVATRAGSLPDPRKPPGVPSRALDEPLLDTPDDPRNRWPVYLGRIVMSLPESGTPAFTIDTLNRVYAGVMAELIDHPGNASRIELGRTASDDGIKQIGDEEYRYLTTPQRDFAVFVPDADAQTSLQPTLSVFGSTTQIRGTTQVHGNLVLDGASVQFLGSVDTDAPVSEPAIYRSGETLRINAGSLADGNCAVVIGVMKGSEFQPALEVRFENAVAGVEKKPVVIVHGDLRIQGAIQSPDMRTRTVTGDVATMLAGLVQAALATT